MLVASVQASIDAGRVAEEAGPRASRNRLQTTTLLDAIAEHGFDAAFGSARRDDSFTLIDEGSNDTVGAGLITT